MNRLLKYKDFLHQGVWHCHTNYTDGANDAFDMCQAAQDAGFSLIAFTEHVRKKLNYNFFDLANDVDRARKKFSMTILLGAEAKVLNLDGELDISDEVVKCCDLVVGVFHGFIYDDKASYLEALSNMIRAKKADVWGHPFLYAKRKGFRFTLENYRNIVDLCLKYDVLYEKNIRYDVPGEDFTRLADEMNLQSIIAVDAHSIDDVYNFGRIIKGEK